MRRERQFAAGDQVELSRLAPDLQHHSANRIAGQCVGDCAQRMVHVGGANADEKARIEAKFSEPAHRQGARLDFGEILPDPNHGPPHGHPACEAGDKACGGRTLPPGFRKHLMHRPQREPALQACVGLRMPEHDPSWRIPLAMNLKTMGLKTLDAAA